MNVFTSPFRFVERRRLGVVLGLGLILAGGLAAPEDWPTFRHDIARSGVTSESPQADLARQWVSVPTQGPQVAWPDPQKEKPRTLFDEGFQVAVVGDVVYFGSSADNKVYALDAATGHVRWTAFTGGPVRCAPTVWDGKVYVGSDDGYAYCLRADDGAVVWRVRGSYGAKKVLGNEKMISLWPVRTGVLVDEGVAYFGAGVFPHESTFVCAVDAEDGSWVWCNDTCGEAGSELEYGGMTPQGHLLASGQTLYVPSGRAMPGAFDREDGRFLYYCSPGGKVGGTWALVSGDRLVAGMETKKVYDEGTGARTDAEYAWFPGYQLVVAEKCSYLLGYRELRALDRKAHEYAGKWRSSIIQERDKLSKELEQMRRGRVKLAIAEREAHDKKMAQSAEKIKTLSAQQRQVEDGVHKWRRPLEQHDSMILAGDALLVGGHGAVVMLDAVSGKESWSGTVEGRAVGLAAAGGRLFVSTDTGAIYCFGPGGTDAGEVKVAVSDAPFPQDDEAALYAKAAEAILAQTGIDKGFCLVLASGEGRLAYELAKRTELKVVGIEPDGAKAAKARRALDGAGLYGRVIFDEGPLDALDYADYFANLIVSDAMVLSGKPVGSAAEVLRVLKPCGGMVCLGQPDGVSGMDAAEVMAWLGEPSEAPERKQVDEAGTWVVLERGPLAGAGKWTHQYADTANTACSDDIRVKAPLGVLWFGEPGPQYMVERHARAAAPVAMDGRLFVQGENTIMAYDSYNGVLLWKREMPGAVRLRVDSDMGNLALVRDGLYVVTHGLCTRLDPATGEVVRTYDLPPVEGDKPHRWGYVACTGDTLFGSVAKPLRQDYNVLWDTFASEDGQWKDLDKLPAQYKDYVRQYPKPDERAYWRQQQGGLTWNSMARWPAWGSVDKPEGAITSKIMASHVFFALDTETGNERWRYEGSAVAHPAIAIADGLVYLADCGVTDAEKGAAIEAKKALLEKGTWEDGGEMKYEPQHADVRRVVALDAKTGRTQWERVIDLTGCGGDRMGLAYKDGVLLAFGCFSNHDRHLFRDGKLTWRRITALDGKTGEDLWSKPRNYLRRPVIMGDEILIEPRACDLRTGAIKTRRHPLTGKEETWEFVRPGHCCSVTSASPTMFFMRGYFMWYYDMVKDQGMRPFGAIRPGCWINLIPADGLLLFPEASAGCTCSYPIRCTVAMAPKPKEEEHTWAVCIQHGAMMPVEHMAVNLGAPGDWRADDGTLWFGYPHHKGNAFFQYGVNFQIQEKFLDGMGFISRNFRGIRVENTDRPWLYASAAQGLAQCTLPLLDEGQGPGTYTVRLHFADMANTAQGRRVFDVKLQGKRVLKKFDIVKEAGGPSVAVVKEFGGVKVEDKLEIELAPKLDNPGPDQAPILSGVEVIREDVAVAKAL